MHPIIDLPAHPLVEGVLVPFPGLVLELPQDGPLPIAQARHIPDRLFGQVLRDAVSVALQPVDLVGDRVPASV